MLRMSITLLSSALALTTSKSTNSMERSVSHFSLQSQHLQHQTKLNGEVSITLLSSVSALTTSKPTNSVKRSVSRCSLQRGLLPPACSPSLHPPPPHQLALGPPASGLIGRNWMGGVHSPFWLHKNGYA